MTTIALAPPLQRVIDALKTKGCKPRNVGPHQYSARCPAHEDDNPSLSISLGDNGGAVLHCHGSCAPEEIVAALGLTLADLFADAPRTPTGTNGRAAHAPRVRPERTDVERPRVVFATAADAVAARDRHMARHEGRPPHHRVWKYLDSTGKHVASVIRWNAHGALGKAIRPVAFTGRGWQLCSLPRLRPLYALPELLTQRDSPVWIVEGEPAADAARGVGLLATTAMGGAEAANAADWSPLAGRQVVISPDNDDAGERYVEGALRNLAKLSPRPTVCVVRLPDLPPKGDFADYVAARTSTSPEQIRADVEALADAADKIDLDTPADEPSETSPEHPAEQSTPDDDDSDQDQRPRVVLGTDEATVVDEMVTVLRCDPNLFQRDGRLVSVTHADATHDAVQRDEGSPTIRELCIAAMRDRITRYIRVVRCNSNGKEVSAHVPQWAPAAMLARGEWPGIRRLVGISTTPIVRLDGNVMQTPGYDPASGLLYVASDTFPEIPAGVGIDDASEAMKKLETLVEDFPFATPANQVAFVAALLSVLGRGLYGGCAPLFLFDANVAGSGKTRLVQLIARIALGRSAATLGYSQHEEEMGKRVTSVVMAGDPLVLLDNVTGTLGDGQLDRMLTSERWGDRILHSNIRVDLPMRTVWCVTANNAALRPDTIRRSLHVRLQSTLEHPETRNDFKHPDILGWAGEHRGALVAAGLTILSAYQRFRHHGGTPAALPAMGSYEPWSDTIRQAVFWVSGIDPYETRLGLLEAADVSGNALSRLVVAWEAYERESGIRGFEAADLLRRLFEPPTFCMGNAVSDATTTELRDALNNFAGGTRPLDGRRLGRQLRTVKDRRVDGTAYFTHATTGSTDDARPRAIRWTVKRDSQKAPGVFGEC